MISRRLLLASGALLACGSALIGPASIDPALAQAGDPVAIVQSIYNGKDRFGAAVSLQMRAPPRRALSKSLASVWKRSDDRTPAEDEPVPGFDVASMSQGMDVARAIVKLERQDAKSATVVATLIPGSPFHRNAPEENVVRYDFIREGGRWKIDDVRGFIKPDPWSLKHELSEALKR